MLIPNQVLVSSCSSVLRIPPWILKTFYNIQYIKKIDILKDVHFYAMSDVIYVLRKLLLDSPQDPSISSNYFFLLKINLPPIETCS